MTGVYIWGTGWGTPELIERGLSREGITAFVESNPDFDEFLGRPVLPPERVPVSDCDLMIVTSRHVEEITGKCAGRPAWLDTSESAPAAPSETGWRDGIPS